MLKTKKKIDIKKILHIVAEYFGFDNLDNTTSSYRALAESDESNSSLINYEILEEKIKEKIK